MAVYDVFAGTPLFLTDSVNINIKIIDIEDVVELTDTIKTNILQQSIIDHVYLNDEVHIGKTLQVSSAHDLALIQSGQRTPLNVSAFDNLDFWQVAEVIDNWPDVLQALTLMDGAEFIAAKGVYDTLVLTQTVLVTKSIHVVASNTLIMHSSATVFKPDQFWTSFDVVVVNP